MKNIVEFEGEGPVPVNEGQTVLNAALSAGIRHMHVCGGCARCSTCRILVLEGGSALSPRNEAERLLNMNMQYPQDVRLACQTTVGEGRVKLKRIIRDESDIDLYADGDRLSLRQIGEEQELVLFFFDIRDFTAFASTHLAFDIIHIIRKLFSEFQKIIEAHNGEIIETMGDGFYAVFSCKEGSSEGVCSGIQSGLSIIKKLDSLNETYFIEHFGQRLQGGIGLHIGKVISGEIQVGSHVRRLAMGLPVNIAARLQDATKELNNSFIISSEAFMLLTEKPKGFTVTTVHLRGLAGPREVFLLGTAYGSNLS